ncbi:MAG: beta-CASP ribonuclease aCPSF1 [Candidatus ainarchaeum sp.]|nr:beta-CASP ribonuclease aCPSF1 [Candidatus ainarchaeum sp.]
MVQKVHILKEVNEKLKEILPREANISKIEFEGPELVLYTKTPNVFFDSPNNLVSKIAFELKKKINIRTDKSLLIGKEQAKKLIESYIPKDADVKEIYFDEPFCEVVIEAVKKGLVIGKGGEISKKIIMETGWIPRIIRAPTSDSKTLSGIRKHMYKHSDERKKFLLDLSEKIFSEPKNQSHRWVRLTALGGYREVGRSCSLLETEQTKILLDAGVNFSETDPFPYVDALGYTMNEIDAIVLSHAHSDHNVLIPYLSRLGFNGPIYCTEPTRDLMALIQFDYIKVNVANGKDPVFTEQDVKNVLLHTVTRDYKEVTDISPDMRITFHNAAHILGSASTHINIGEGNHNLLYTGDIKYGMTRLFDNIDIKYPRIETMIIESTYGSKDATQTERNDAEKQLLDIIRETNEYKGSVLIPVFGVGRGQEICMVIENFYKKGLITDQNKIYVDGMVREASAIHTAYPEFLRQSLEKRILTNDSPFDSPIFKEATRENKDKIVNEPGSIIIATSGMMNGGPVVDYFYKMAENPANTLLFVGYLAENTLGRKIQQGLKTMAIFDENGKTKKLDVKMRIETIDGFSGHSDHDQLIDYVGSLKPSPKKIIVQHGDPVRSIEFSKEVSKRFGISSNALRILDSLRLR